MVICILQTRKAISAAYISSNVMKWGNQLRMLILSASFIIVDYIKRGATTCRSHEYQTARPAMTGVRKLQEAACVWQLPENLARHHRIAISMCRSNPTPTLGPVLQGKTAGCYPYMNAYCYYCTNWAAAPNQDRAFLSAKEETSGRIT